VEAQELKPGRAVEPPPPDLARLVFYRTAEMIGVLIKPKVIINNQKTGKAVRKKVWWVDLPPGDYELSLSTEVKRKINFRAEAGRVVFVRTRPQTGVAVARLTPEIVDRAEAEPDLIGLGFPVSV